MILPKEFEHLAPWCETWVVADSAARSATRQASEYSDVKAFYDAMLEVAPRALEFLSEHKLGDLDPGAETLLKLMLSFAEVTTAVEFYDQKEVVDGFPLDRFRPTEPLSDLAPQE
jgi:hypothetical protein